MQIERDPTSHRRRKRLRGVTLIEVLIVVSIMGLLAAAVAVAIFPLGERAKIDTATTNARMLRYAAEGWRARYGGGECPTIERLISDKVVDRGSAMTDPWGGRYAISCTEDDVTVVSPGPDRKNGTADDILAPPETRTARE